MVGESRTNYYVAVHALIYEADRVMIIRRSMADEYMPGAWDLPGGTIGFDESIPEGLIREVREETNLEIEVREICFVHLNSDQMPNRQTVQLILRCKKRKGFVRLSVEHDEVRWVPLHAIQGLRSMNYLNQFVRSEIDGSRDQPD